MLVGLALRKDETLKPLADAVATTPQQPTRFRHGDEGEAGRQIEPALVGQFDLSRPDQSCRLGRLVGCAYPGLRRRDIGLGLWLIRRLRQGGGERQDQRSDDDESDQTQRLAGAPDCGRPGHGGILRLSPIEPNEGATRDLCM